MKALEYCLSIHVPNVWQTCEWYHQVFGLPVFISTDTSTARLNTSSQRLFFVADSIQDELFGARRRNSFLADPPAFHISIPSSDVPATFAHALAHGAVPVREPASNAEGYVVASLRDLNGILVQLISDGVVEV